MQTSGQESTTAHQTQISYIQSYSSETTTNLTLPDMGLFEAILAQAIIHNCLLNLVPCGHHEWTVLHDVLVERLSGDQDEIGVIHQSGDGNARLLTIGGQNKRVVRSVRCARVANGNTPIQNCDRYLS